MIESFIGKCESVGVAGHSSVFEVIDGTEQKLFVTGGGLDQRLRALLVFAGLVHLKKNSDVTKKLFLCHQWYHSQYLS